MHRVLMVVTALSLAGAMEAKAAGASTKPPLSGWATAAGVGSKTGSAFDRVNEIANEALQLTTSSEPAPAPTPERIRGHRRISAKTYAKPVCRALPAQRWDVPTRSGLNRSRGLSISAQR